MVAWVNYIFACLPIGCFAQDLIINNLSFQCQKSVCLNHLFQGCIVLEVEKVNLKTKLDKSFLIISIVELAPHDIFQNGSTPV